MLYSLMVRNNLKGGLNKKYEKKLDDNFVVLVWGFLSNVFIFVFLDGLFFEVL